MLPRHVAPGAPSAVAKADAELAARLVGLLEHLPDFFVVTDRDGFIQFVNRVVAPWTFEQVHGVHWTEFLQPWERDRGRARLEAALASGAPELIEVAGYGEHGVERMYAAQMTPIIEHGAASGAILVCRDVSDQRQAEAQLRVADRLATVGTLAAGAAHGINNPLSAVIANLAVALRAIEGVGDRAVSVELTAALREAGEAAMRIGEVVTDLNVFVRSEDTDLRPVDVHAVVESTLRLAWNEIRHRARLVKQLDPVPQVLGNAGRLGQVLLNLLVNAAQAIVEGRADRNEIRVVTSTSNDRVAIEITDTGVGMTPDVIERLFTPFFTTKPIGDSTGLGLAVSQRIISGFSGEITVESMPGVGSTFTVWLPAHAPVAEKPTTRIRPVGGQHRARVLVIDDEMLITRAIARVLGGRHEVVVENAAAAALARIAAGERFDAILCDVMMPEVTGMDVYEELERIAPDQLERTTFMTGGAFTARARALLDRAEVRWIAKPFSPAELLDAIAGHIA